MAVYTKLSEDKLKEFFLKYNLGELLSFKEIKEGIENTNYFIQTKKGKFISFGGNGIKQIESIKREINNVNKLINGYKRRIIGADLYNPPARLWLLI